MTLLEERIEVLTELEKDFLRPLFEEWAKRKGRNLLAMGMAKTYSDPATSRDWWVWQDVQAALLAKEADVKTLQEVADKFNREFPHGTLVTITKDGKPFNTRVVREAYILSGHSAVVHLEGLDGCWSVEDDRVTARKEVASGK